MTAPFSVYMAVAISGAGTVYLSGIPEFTNGF
jgi:hypothetical protein